MKPLKRIFDLKSQKNFSKLSGDYNPIHLDKSYARRNLSGDIVVYGIDYILWGLNEWIKKHKKKILITSIKINFLKALKINDKLSLSYVSKKNIVKIIFSNQYSDIANIELKWKKDTLSKKIFLNKLPKKLKPEIIDIKDIMSIAGKENLYLKNFLLKKLYPHLFRYLNNNQISNLLTISRIVGMKVPGLNSLLFRIELKSNNKISKTLNYKVIEYDSRIRLSKIFVNCFSFSGTVSAFVRPELTLQDNLKTISTIVTKGKFKNQRALIIGGSRGIGELTTKILLMGSANLYVSYNQGEKEIINLKKEIGELKNKVYFKKIDVLKVNKSSILKTIKDFKPTHFYYFATPHIFSGNAFNFSRKNFDNFNDIYLNGFLNIFEMLNKKYLKKVFYPSTIALKIPEAKLFDYATSKAASEMMCKYLQKKYKNIMFYIPRLPRLQTDQTSNLFSKKIKNNTKIILNHLIKFN